MKTLLFGVSPGPDIASARSVLAKEGSFIDGIELRLDHFEKIDLPSLKSFIEKYAHPVILTLRRKDQGGAFSGSEEERLALLESLCALQPAYMDLEYDVPAEFRQKLFKDYPQIQFISSYHHFKQTPDDLKALYDQIKTPHAHIYKMAVTAQSAVDALRMLSFVHVHSVTEKIIGISMGEEGRMSRILAPLVGGYLTYASLSESGSTAPGQIGAREMQEVYHFRKLNRHSSIYALIGAPVDKSLGHLIHNAVFEQMGRNAVYLKISVKKEELSPFFAWVRKLPFKGFSVTMPHKERVIPFLNHLSQQVQMIGACNTIAISNGLWMGHNTDGVGALDAIEKQEVVLGKHIVFIGAGGAAKALIFEAIQRGAQVTVLNRTAEKAIAIAEPLGARGGGWELFPTICKMGYDVIVNCIPESDLIDEEWILPEKIAMDIVYVPKNTPFLIKSHKKKCRIVFGFEMFIGQAVVQQQIWFPESTDLEKTYAIIEEKVLKNLP